MLYVLIVISWAHGGNQTVVMQQFSSKATCEVANRLVQEHKPNNWSVIWSGCTEY